MADVLVVATLVTDDPLSFSTPGDGTDDTQSETVLAAIDVPAGWALAAFGCVFDEEASTDPPDCGIPGGEYDWVNSHPYFDSVDVAGLSSPALTAVDGYLSHPATTFLGTCSCASVAGPTLGSPITAGGTITIGWRVLGLDTARATTAELRDRIVVVVAYKPPGIDFSRWPARNSIAFPHGGIFGYCAFTPTDAPDTPWTEQPNYDTALIFPGCGMVIGGIGDSNDGTFVIESGWTEVVNEDSITGGKLRVVLSPLIQPSGVTFEPVIGSYSGFPTWWADDGFSWNFVCRNPAIYASPAGTPTESATAPGTWSGQPAISHINRRTPGLGGTT